MENMTTNTLKQLMICPFLFVALSMADLDLVLGRCLLRRFVRVCVCDCVCMCVCRCVCMHACVCLCVCIYSYLCVETPLQCLFAQPQV